MINKKRRLIDTRWDRIKIPFEIKESIGLGDFEFNKGSQKIIQTDFIDGL